MTVPPRHHCSVERRREGALAARFLVLVVVVVGCTAPIVAPPSASQGPAARTPPPTASPPPVSPSPVPPSSFTWAARPDVFAGEDGASLTAVAAGPAGFVAVATRDQSDGTRTTRLWSSVDGSSWQPAAATGLSDPVLIDGVWGAGDRYWLVGHLPDTDDPGTLYRSSDGRAWQAIPGAFPAWSVVDACDGAATGARDACPLFLTGSRDVDGVIVRSTDGGASWADATVEDARGVMGAQDAAPVEILGVVATSDGLLAYGNGLAKASDTSGFLQARFWRSTDDGATWARVPNAAPLGELYVRGIAAAGRVVVAVGERVAEAGSVALLSTDGGRTWARASTSPDAAEGVIYQPLAEARGFLGLGFANPADVDRFPLREFVWTSDDGTAWHTAAAGDLEGGIVDDVVQAAGLILAVGRAWTTDATGSWKAPYGPAAWAFRP